MKKRRVAMLAIHIKYDGDTMRLGIPEGWEVDEVDLKNKLLEWLTTPPQCSKNYIVVKCYK